MAGTACQASSSLSPCYSLMMLFILHPERQRSSMSGSTSSPRKRRVSRRLSLLQSFRHEMRAAGVRVLSIFTGPVDNEDHQTVPPPKVPPPRIASAIVDALQQGREQSCVGDVAADAMARWQADPALYARERQQ